MMKQEEFIIEDGILGEYLGTAENVIIPEGVTEIGKHAFDGSETLKSVVIPEGVTCIREFAFARCKNLTSIVIPESVVTTGILVFGWCHNLKSICFSGQNAEIERDIFLGCPGLTEIKISEQNQKYTCQDGFLYDNQKKALLWCARNKTSVTVPEGIERIEEYAFFCCENLTAVRLPESLLSIGERAFWNCITLPEINFPENLIRIESCAFHGCEMLTSVTLPEHLSEIGERAFDCNHLENIVIPEQNQHYVFHNGAVYDKQMKTLLFCLSGIEHIRIPRTVTHIRSYAFQECRKLKSIVIPESVESIGKDIFCGCENLKRFKILNQKFTFAGWRKYYVNYHREYFEDYGDQTVMQEVPEFLLNGEFNVEYMPPEMQYDLMLRLLRSHTQHENFLKMIRENIQPFLMYLLMENVSYKNEFMQAVLDRKLVTQETIDPLIQITNEEKAYDIQMMLMNYKYQNLDFKNIDKELKL
ncbi:MAG: leucine-rich repeat domain-containing protein [Oscillospiraceae bacterium]|nr:leucine-rich repeat domain-containing protein [Oscillospiraceae bacterium]